MVTQVQSKKWCCTICHCGQWRGFISNAHSPHVTSRLIQWMMDDVVKVQIWFRVCHILPKLAIACFKKIVKELEHTTIINALPTEKHTWRDHWKPRGSKIMKWNLKTSRVRVMKRPAVATSRYIKNWMVIGNVGWDVWFKKETSQGNN